MPERKLVSPRRCSTTLLSLGCLLSAPAAQQFAPQPIAQGDFGARAPQPLDLDGDGDLDFVGLVGNGSRLHHWRNLGGSRCASFATTSGRGLNDFLDRRTAAADFDGDGDNDLLMANSGGVGVVMLRNGQSRFADPAIALPSANISLVGGVRLLDADRDGDVDVFVRSATAIGLLLNDGTGNFTVAPAIMLPAAAGNAVAEVADLDADGGSDMAVVDNNGLLATWLLRPGGLVDESATRLPAGLPTMRLTVIDDVDNDGDRDIVAASSQTPVSVLLLRNNGSGVFTADPTAFVGTPAAATSAVAADLDGDGDRDVVVDRFLFVNDGAGRFTPGVPLNFAPIAVIDLDGDPFLDLLTANSIVHNDGGRRLVELRRCYGLAPGDLDGDGDSDVMGNAGSWIVEGSRHGWRSGSTSATITTSLVDLDRDGDADLIERTTAAVSVFGNDGTGSFTRVLQAPSQSIAAGLPGMFDLDGDGDLDLAWGTGTFGATAAVVMRNDGNLTFTDVTAATLPPGTRFMPSVIGADLDADGLDDLVLASLAGASWLRNRGNGTLEDASARLSPGFGGEVLRAAQLDRDPELELVAVRNPNVFLLDRVGTDWVDASARLPGSAAPATSVVTLDFDSDGDIDLAIAGGGGFLLQNDGNGRFTDVTSALGPLAATTFAAFDADGDGDPDILDGFDLWLNHERQLALAAPVAVGGQLVVEFVAQPGFGVSAAACVVALGLQRSPRGLPLFGGTLIPEPASSVVLGAVVSAGGQPGQRTLPVPNNPLLRGLVLQTQGLVIGTRGELALANHLTVTID
ncbi:MAG: VCBS repeat-containing protein [Planctomycetes bacterium]|nr:VCBS repeat-containing protein [Planctomycetota bacterium]